MNRRSTIALGAIVALGSLAAGVMLGNRQPAEPVPATPPALAGGTWLEPAQPLPEFRLISAAGKPVTREDLAGRWSLLFFGFTHCPEACPVTLALLGQARAALADLPPESRPGIVLVTVDPDRDTPERLHGYLAGFDAEAIGLTGSVEELARFGKPLGVLARKMPPMPDGSYMVDHNLGIHLIAPTAERVAVFGAPQQLDALVADLRTILSP